MHRFNMFCKPSSSVKGNDSVTVMCHLFLKVVLKGRYFNFHTMNVKLREF